MRIFMMAATMLGALAAPAHANLLTNGSFEAFQITGAPWFARSFSSTPGWTQYGDGVDLIHNNYTQGPAVLVDASDGVQFLDMNQAGAIGGLFQVVGATAGTTYNLSLDATAWATNARGGTIGYQLYDPTSNAVLAGGSFTDPTGGTWVRRTLSAAATSNQIGVRVFAIASTQAGMGLDNVVLNAAVPEPASWALMISGFGLTGAAARRRQTASSGVAARA
jgi:hypothetical protein